MFDLAVVDHGWWLDACKVAGFEPHVLDGPVAAGANPYSAGFEQRLAAGDRWRASLPPRRPWLLLDNGAAGLAFIEGPGGTSDLKLFNEEHSILLASHFIDPVVTVAQGMPFGAFWQCLRSRTWTKAVWDYAQAEELRRFGIPNVVHLPMAALDRAYPTEPPLAEHTDLAPVSFVGSQNCSYFAEGNGAETTDLLPGIVARATQAGMGDIPFYDIYFDLYGLSEPPQPSDDLRTSARKAAAYFQAKLFYNAGGTIRQRDRFVVFLKRQLGDDFQIHGTRWDETYGLSCRPPIAAYDEYLDHFRRTPININLVSGNAETGLNMRHFEITAAGGFMLCYVQPELGSCFRIGEECDVFSNEQELLEKVRHYLARPGERRRIALAGQRRTLSGHLFSHRLRTLLSSIQAIIQSREGISEVQHEHANAV